MDERIPYEVVEDSRGVRVMRGADLIGWTSERSDAESFARELNALQELERSAYERGLREGREVERADAVAWLRAWRCGKWRYLKDIAEDIERAEHAPTPQGDAPLSRSQERRLAAQRDAAPKPCATCGGSKGTGVVQRRCASGVERFVTCPDCAGERGGC